MSPHVGICTCVLSSGVYLKKRDLAICFYLHSEFYAWLLPVQVVQEVFEFLGPEFLYNECVIDVSYSHF